MPRVKRSCNSDKNYPSGDEMTEEDALKASWDYWERQGHKNPMKRIEDKIKPLSTISALRAGDN